MEIHLIINGRCFAVWDHAIAARHKRTHPALTPASEGW